MHVTDFRPEHILMMDIQPHQAWMREAVENGYGEVLARGVSQTVWDGEIPIACFGQVLLWENNGEVWSVFASDIGTRMTYVYRATRRLIASVSTRRLQAYVDAHFEEGVRWMFRLGFMIEGRLDGYFPNGNDAYLFAMTRGAAPVPQVRPFAMVDQYDERDMLAKILRLESEMRAMPQAEFETTHHFAPGIYGRTIHIPKGSLLTGKMHATDHLSIVSQGDISVLTESGIQRIKAPAIVPAKAGMKRVGFAHEDTVWTTIHGTHETDLERLEAELIVPERIVMEVLP
jgi:hypothetical protein